LDLRAREVLILLALCALASLPGACGSVKNPTPGDPCGGLCGPDEVCVDGACADPCEGVECEADLVCIGGECVDVPIDADGDGFEAGSDCDDEDPTIGPGSTRECSTKCGNGIEVCRDATWQDCTAPSECECTEPREEPCELCGTSIRDCIDGRYAFDAGPCTGMGACEPKSVGIVECGCEGIEDPCDACGTREFGRTCLGDCTWGPPEGDCIGLEEEDPELCAAEVPFCNSNGICVPLV
jgi:hypothetical protein